jgi:simple sugar transport system ATP-binding protein
MRELKTTSDIAFVGPLIRCDDEPNGRHQRDDDRRIKAVAIARAIHFGARVLILDEPTAALGVKQSGNVLRLINHTRERGISVIFITHNANHAYPVADSFTILNHGRSLGTYTKGTITKDELIDMMAGGAEMKSIVSELAGVTI